MVNNELIKAIQAYEAAGRILEPGQEDREHMAKQVNRYCDGFLDRVDYVRTFFENGEKAGPLRNSDFSEQCTIEDILQDLASQLEEPGINTAAGGHLGYIPGGGLYAAALGDYIADVTNKYAGVYYASPGAVNIENSLIDWAGRLVGYQNGFGGNITSGGSIGNLVGIIAARDAHELKGRDLERTVVYSTRLSHHSVSKALVIAGLRECITREIPLDNNYRMDVARLEEQIKDDIANGLKPFLLVANAGSTDLGTIDPLQAIRDVTGQYNIWMHVDGAYGGSFLLLDDYRDRMKGISHADSIVMDPHKGMFLPYGTGIVLVKKLHHLQNAFVYEAGYMQDVKEKNGPVSPATVSPELSKHFRSMRMWLPLKLYGEQPFKDCLREKLLLTRYFCEKIKALGFELVTEPELTVVAYRYIPQTGDVNLFNKRLMELMHEDGDIFISSTTVDGCYVLRFAALSFRTHLSHVDRLLAMFERQLPKCISEFH